MKEFFQTSEGSLHTGRIAGLLFAAGVAICLAKVLVMKMETICWMRIIFTVGWWSLFGVKRPARTLSDMAHPLGVIGLF